MLYCLVVPKISVHYTEIDRPENQPPTRGLPGILAKAIGREIEQIYISSNKASYSAIAHSDYKLSNTVRAWRSPHAVVFGMRITPIMNTY